MGLGQKIKDAVTPGSKQTDRHHNINDPAYNQTGTYNQTTGTTHETTYDRQREGMGTPMGAGAGAGYGAGETGAVGAGHEERHESRREERHEEVDPNVCGRQTFVQVEDRPVLKERVERVVEHRPVEKQFVQETRFVGEHAIPSATGETSLGVTERVVEKTEPGPTCPNPNAPIMDTEGHRVGGVGQGRTMDM
ncbi:MAG: hypothetical protein J3K34DRAFT_522246 [Monoraphidium minutum]|nr:MAG: hypothetical protein J3K34DRAFT_522246 [Monoraphidium minutum]